MNKVFKLLFMFFVIELYLSIATDVVLSEEWDINLFPVSTPSKSTLKIGDTVKIEFSGYNNDRRPMYNPNLEIILPNVMDYVHLRDTVLPSTDVELKKNSVEWNNIEQHVKGLSKGDVLKRPDSWWCIIKEARAVKPGTGKVTAKLTWEDKGGKEYERDFLLKTVTVTGKPEERQFPETQPKQNQTPKILGIDVDKISHAKASFNVYVVDLENDPIEIQWKIDDKDWSSWGSENVIKEDELTPGEHTIHVKAREKDGDKKESEVKEREFTIPENQSPIFAIDGPYYPASNIVRFHFTGEDPEGDAFKYIYEVKDESGETIRPEESVNGPMNIVFLSLPSGTYTIVVKAKDDKGKESKPKESDEFVIENRGPVAKISKQEDQLSFSATDHEGDIVSQFIYKISDEEGNIIATKKVSTDGSEAVVPINGLSPGTYKISVQAEDDRGNQGDSVEREFTVENRGPVAKISEPLYGDRSVEFRLSAVDQEKDAIVDIKLRAVNSVGKSYLINLGLQQFKAGKEEHIIITPGEYSRLEQIEDDKSNTGTITSSLPPGDYRLIARAKDDKGNMGEAKKRDFKVSEPVSLSISRGEVAPLGKDIGGRYDIGWGYELCASRHFTPSWSSSLSFGFQKFYQKGKSLQIIPLYVRGTYLLLKTSNRRFQLKPFFGLGINFYKFDPSQTYANQPYDYDNAITWGPEMGLIMDFAVLPPTSSNNVSFILQGGANYTYHSDFQSVFTSLMLGIKYRF